MDTCKKMDTLESTGVTEEELNSLCPRQSFVILSMCLILNMSGLVTFFI